jgi:hypothetical protein
LNKIEFTEKRPAYAITWQSIESVERYAANRYKHFDQRLVSWRERQIIDHFLKSLANNHQTILDIPTGYGRFTALFRRYGLGQINGDLNLYALLYHRQCHPDSRMSVVTMATACRLAIILSTLCSISVFCNILKPRRESGLIVRASSGNPKNHNHFQLPGIDFHR